MNDSETLTDRTESPKIQKLREDLIAWLTAEPWTHEELTGWLKGYTLPALGYEDDPYDWILRAFPSDNSAAHYKSIFASRIVEFLHSEAFYRQIYDDDRLLFNLFYLCANLNRKEELAPSLEEVFDFFQSHEREREAFFSEKKMYNLNAAFREALIANQTNAKYLPFWRSILEQQQPPILRGNIFSGFLGVLFASKKGEPLVDEIAWALGKMADYFVQTNDKKRLVKFRNLMTRIKEVWDGYDWDKILFFHTIKRPWQHWATVRLPRLIMPLGNSPDGFFGFMIWSVYLPFLKVLKLNFRELSKEDIFCKIEVPANLAKTLEAKLSETERERLRAPFNDYESVAKAMREYLYMDLSDEEDYTENESLTNIRIRTYEPATLDPAKKEEKQIEAQNALTETLVMGQSA